MQGVPLSRRFALVPLGPPLLTYSSTARAMLRWDAATGHVVLEADRAYAAGEPVLAWCGPQPNARLLINYGIVDEQNPYDRLPLTGNGGGGGVGVDRSRCLLGRRRLRPRVAYSSRRCQCHLFCPC